MSGIRRMFNGREWEHWMNMSDMDQAKLFAEIAAGFGFDILVNKECYIANGRKFVYPAGIWRTSGGLADMSGVWEEYRKQERETEKMITRKPGELEQPEKQPEKQLKKCEVKKDKEKEKDMRTPQQIAEQLWADLTEGAGLAETWGAGTPTQLAWGRNLPCEPIEWYWNIVTGFIPGLEWIGLYMPGGCHHGKGKPTTGIAVLNGEVIVKEFPAGQCPWLVHKPVQEKPELPNDYAEYGAFITEGNNIYLRDELMTDDLRDNWLWVDGPAGYQQAPNCGPYINLIHVMHIHSWVKTKDYRK